MGLNTKAVVAALESKCKATGLFRKVNTHEPKRPPDHDLTAAVWLENIRPVPFNSGLANTSAVAQFQVRLYTKMLQEPPDAIDPTMMAAADTLMTNITADFDLGATIEAVDLLGMAGTPMAGRAGYLDIGGTMFRVFDIVVPCIIAEAWPQTA